MLKFALGNIEGTMNNTADTQMTTAPGLQETIPSPAIADHSAVLRAFLGDQDVRDTSLAVYDRVLRLFFRWLDAEGRQLSRLTLADVNDYKKALFDRGLSSLTVATYVTALKKFYAWAEATGQYMNIAKSLKTPKRIQAFRKQHLTPQEAGRMLAALEAAAEAAGTAYADAIGTPQEGKRWRAYVSALRDHAIVNLTVRSGLRTIEVTRADIGDVTFKQGKRVLKVWGKGRDQDAKDLDFIVLTEKTYGPIRRYLGTRRGALAGEPLFCGGCNRNDGGRLTTRTVSGICKDALRAIGLDAREYTAHSLRHTAAVTILKSGGNLQDAQRLLRHRSMETTRIYTESIETEERLLHAPEELYIDGAF